jgi:Helix-turn-helix domain
MPIPGQPFNPYKMFIGAFVPNWLLQRKELCQGAKLYYARLAQYAGEDGHAYPSQRALAAELGVSPRQVRKYVTELLQFKLLATRQYGLAQTNAYLFLWHEWAEEGVRQGAEPQFHSRRNYRSRGEEPAFHSERNHSTDKENQEETHEENAGRERDEAEEAQDAPTPADVHALVEAFVGTHRLPSTATDVEARKAVLRRQAAQLSGA